MGSFDRQDGNPGLGGDRGQFTATISVEGRSWPATLRAATPIGAPTRVRAGGFVSRRYVLTLPADAHGTAVLEITGSSGGLARSAIDCPSTSRAISSPVLINRREKSRRSPWEFGPFYGTSYMPELAYQWFTPTTARSEIGGSTWLGFQSGLHHESNSRSGSTARSANTVYVRPLFSSSTYLLLQYFDGYGESLLAYNQHTSASRGDRVRAMKAGTRRPSRFVGRGDGNADGGQRRAIVEGLSLGVCGHTKTAP
jgi:hypothetical protein